MLLYLASILFCFVFSILDAHYAGAVMEKCVLFSPELRVLLWLLQPCHKVVLQATNKGHVRWGEILCVSETCFRNVINKFTKRKTFCQSLNKKLFSSET